MEEGDCVVSQRSNTGAASLGRPEEAVDQKAAADLQGCTLLSYNRLLESPVRFDVIAVLGEEITHFEHAFEFQDKGNDYEKWKTTNIE